MDVHGRVAKTTEKETTNTKGHSNNKRELEGMQKKMDARGIRGMSGVLLENRTIYALRWSQLRRKLISAKNNGWEVTRIYTVQEVEAPMFMPWEKLEIKVIPVRCADIIKRP